ncbi:MAG TPA: cytochrome P450 [Actinophytocola sp.]|uniref:cytochrome P450 n=1 Tax=Actinophytocola sp. TaxID=1872138 RepID=UPI002DBDF357|nr:cytochrome P450 [Actinophytocola sp.]HEU5473618.1 cytochrome P450 [Actinophytocola sp.]
MLVVVAYPFDTLAGSDVEPEGLDLLAQGPVTRARWNGVEVWLALGYQVVRQVLADPRFSRAAAAVAGGPVASPAGTNPEFLISMDPPRHTAIRRLMAAAFSPRRVDGLAPWIRRLTEELLDGVAANGRPADLVELFAEPLPVMVICELLGVPVGDRALIRQWAGTLVADTAYTPAQIAEAMGQVNAYLDELIAIRRRDPDDALISALIQANDDGRHLSAAELSSNIQLLLIAGHETTVNQIGNSVVTLFRHPEQARLLAQRPDLRPRAVDELLRYSRLFSSLLPRITLQDLTLGDTRISAGDAVIPLIAVANRDPAAFPDPNRFDITRTGPAPHVALGHGPHYCLGAQLAQLELRIALGALLDRFPTLAPATDLADLRWKPGLAMRALHNLPVTW